MTEATGKDGNAAIVGEAVGSSRDVEPAGGPVPVVLRCDLNLLRCFAGTGVDTIVVSPDPDDVTFNSRDCGERVVIGNPKTDAGAALNQLMEIGERSVEKPVLIYGDDAMLLLVSRHRQRLAERFRFLLPPEELIEQLVDKLRFAEVAERYSIPVPPTISSADCVSADDVRARIPLPCILKPKTHILWFESQTVKEEGAKPRKVLRADTPAELDRALDSMRKFAKEFVIQRYVPGGDDCIYSFHSYLDHESRPLGWFVGRKIRTYPRDSGVSTYLELVKEPELARLSLEILQRMNFVGPIKIDFKKDESSGAFYVLEFNPRFNLWHNLGRASGVNLPMLAYGYLTGAPVARPQDYRTGTRWLSFGNDLRAFLRDYRRDGDLTWLSWLASLRGAKVYDVFDWRDPLPLIKNVVLYSKKLGARLAR